MRTLIALLLLVGCGDDAPQASAPSRVVAVQARESTRTAEAFCDVFPAADQAPPFAMPELADSIATTEGGWRWINVWATWCAPCVEEIPTLVEWEERLAREGAPVDLVLLSVDQSAEVVASFRERVRGVPQTARVADPDAVDEWLGGLGMEGAPTLPVQILVDPRNRARCVRSGPVSEEDYTAVKGLVSG